MTETEKPSNPWERRPEEPSLWFRRFEAYRMLGVGRTLLTAVNQERACRGLKESKNAPGSWKRAAKTWNWEARAEAWDQSLIEAAEARWKAMIMGTNEALARLSEQGRVNIGDFLVCKKIPVQDEDGNFVKDEKGLPLLRDTWDINFEMVKAHGHLIKSISQTRYGPKIELYDGQAATVSMGRHHGLFNDRSLNIDLSKLTDEQLNRLAVGEDIVHVLATTGSSGA